MDKINGTIQHLLSILAGFSKNPIAILIALGATGLAVGLVVMFVKGKLRRAEEAAVTHDTEVGHQEQIDTRTVENTTNTEKDNANRDALDEMT